MNKAYGPEKKTRLQRRIDALSPRRRKAPEQAVENGATWKTATTKAARMVHAEFTIRECEHADAELYRYAI